MAITKLNLIKRVISLFLQGLSIRQIRFRFDGQPINETDTPAQVGKTHDAKSVLLFYNVAATVGIQVYCILFC